MLKKIIIGPGYPLRGGISESNQALDRCFQKSGEYSQIISYSLQYPKVLFPGKKQIIDGVIEKHTTTLNMINTLNPFSWFKTAKYIISQKPDYVIIRYWHPYFSICLSVISKILRKKSIVIIGWVDNVEPHESIPFQRILISRFIKYCDAFLVMSSSVKHKLLQYNTFANKKIIISPHPIYTVFGDIIDKNTARKRIGIDSVRDDKYILFFGLIRKYKGLDLLLDVMNSSRIKNMNIKLIIAGEFYDSKEQYIDKIKSLDLNDSILLYDFYIPNEDVVNYFCAADIVVQPYLSATQSGVSMVSYNFNKPMILTNVGGLSEYVNDKIDGYLVDVNTDAIVSALIDYYANNRESLFVNAIKNKKSSYSWKSLAFQFNSLYNNLKNV